MSVWDKRWTAESSGEQRLWRWGHPHCTCALSSGGAASVSTLFPGLPASGPYPTCLQSQVPVRLCSRVGFCTSSQGAGCTRGTWPPLYQPRMGSAVAKLRRHPHLQRDSGLCRRQALRQGPASRTHEGVPTRCQDQPGGITIYLKEMMPRLGLEEPAGVS